MQQLYGNVRKATAKMFVGTRWHVMLKYIKYKVWRCILQCCIDAIWIANVGETTEEAKVLDVGTSDAELQNCTCMLIKHFCYKQELQRGVFFIF